MLLTLLKLKRGRSQAVCSHRIGLAEFAGLKNEGVEQERT